MQCEMCGKEIESAYSVLVEGVQMDVCRTCSAHGKMIPKKEEPRPQTFRKQQPETMEFVDLHFGELVKQKREAMGMRQKDLAKFLNEKESLIHQIESGHIKPSQRLIDKLRAKLGLNLMREAKVQEYANAPAEEDSETYTLGDFLKK